MDGQCPPRAPKQRIAAPNRLGGGRITLRLDLQRCLELRQLSRGLPDAPVLAVLSCLGAPAALWPHAIWRHRQLPRDALGTRALPWLVPARRWCQRGWTAHARNRGYDGLACAGTRHTCVREFPAYAALAVEWPCGSAYTEGHGEEG